MVNHMMGGAMMWGMGLIGLLVIIVLILAAAGVRWSCPIEQRDAALVT